MSMDPFFFDQNVVDEDYLMSPGLLPSPAGGGSSSTSSAFVAYRRDSAATVECCLSRRCYPGSGANVPRRMFKYLRRVHAGEAAEMAPAAVNEPAERVSCSSRFRKITRERLRLELLSQGYADLHSFLPPGMTSGSRGGKIAIVAAAAAYIEELKRKKEELERAVPAASRGGGDAMVVKVSFSSGLFAEMDVFEVVLERLKEMPELRVTAIHSNFCADGMWMSVEVVSKMFSCEVEKAVANALMELESGSGRSSFTCQVENVSMT